VEKEFTFLWSWHKVIIINSWRFKMNLNANMDCLFLLAYIVFESKFHMFKE